MKAGHDQKKVAQQLGVLPATISRELKRNTGKRGYRQRQAQAQTKTDKRRAQAAKALKMSVATIALIEEKLLLDWSPEQISGWLKLGAGIAVSHDCIYQHVWSDNRHGEQLYTHLRQVHKKRKKQYGSKDKSGQIRNRAGIDERPAIVEEKPALGFGRSTSC